MKIKEKKTMNAPKTRHAVSYHLQSKPMMNQNYVCQDNLTDEAESQSDIAQYGRQQITQTGRRSAQITYNAAARQIRRGNTFRQNVGKSFTIKRQLQKQAATIRKANTVKKTTKKKAARAAKAIGRAAISLTKGLIALLSALPVTAAILLVIVLAALVICLFSFETGPDTSDVASVVEQANTLLSARIDSIKDTLEPGTAVRVEHTGPEDYWTDVLAVYATEHMDDYDRFVLTPERTDELTGIFEEMTQLKSSTILEEHGPVCIITVHHLTASDLAVNRNWATNQRQYLSVLLSDHRDELRGLLPAPSALVYT